MTSTTRKPRRPQKRDTFTNPDASQMDTLCHYALGPFDRMSWEMDRKWGVDRLPELVTPDLAAIWGRTMANLDAAIRAAYDAKDADASDAARANIVACVESGLRGFKAMDAQAEQMGAKPADTSLIEANIDGYHFAILPDGAAWPILKQQRPELVTVTLRDVALALQLYEGSKWAVEEINKTLPDARLKSVKPDYANGGDLIPF